MKKRIIVLLSMSLFLFLDMFAQNVALKYLSQLPPFPNNMCSLSLKDEEMIRNQISKVIEAIENECERIEKQQPSQQQLMNSVSKKTGISKKKLVEMAEKDDEKEGEKLIQQKVEKEYGISAEELKALENMSEAELEKWGKNYANKRQAKQSGQKEKAEFDRAEEINRLEKELERYVSSWTTLSGDYEKDDDDAKRELRRCLEEVEKKAPQPIYQGEHCTNEKAIEHYFALNEPPCYEAYCSTMSPKKKLLLNKKRADIPQMCDLIARSQILKNDIQKDNFGVNISKGILQDIPALALVKEYAKELYNMVSRTRSKYDER